MITALYGRPFDSRHDDCVHKLITDLFSHGLNPVVHIDFIKILEKKFKKKFAFSVFQHIHEIEKETLALLSVGGDGTMLQASRLAMDSGVPLLGINTGRLGFLTSVGTEQLPGLSQKLVSGQFEIEQRSLLELCSPAKLFGEYAAALNEFTVHKLDSASMITIHTYVDDNYLNAYWADGLIISTPTGSTGYSLSCGGPIIDPASNSFIITPIAPHNLNVRPFLVPDSCVIKLKVEGRREKFMVSLDSLSETITSHTELCLQKAKHSVKLIRFENTHFFSTLRQKLNWGVDKRN